MVSSGTVNSDSSKITSILSDYDSKIESLSSGWKGVSYDNLQAKASEFSSQFSSTIESQTASFATACNLYESYLVAKKNVKISQSNYNSAVSSEDSAKASVFSQDISKYTEEMNKLKTQIKSNLESATSSSLDTGGAAGGSSSVQSAIDWAVNVAKDDSHGYSQASREGNPDYDCSSLVINAYQEAGVPVKDAGATYTGDMKNAFVDSGFKWIPGNPSVDSLKPGDVLLSEDSHTEMYIGDGKNVGAHDDYDGTSGDSSGSEIDIGDYYDHPWDGVLRYKDNDKS